MNHWMRCAWVCVAMLAGLSLWPANARGDADRGWYLCGGGGLNHIDTMKGAEELDTGFRLVATAGYRFSPIFGVELDSGLLRNTFSSSHNLVSRQYPITQVPLVMNGIFSIPNRTNFEPYLGGGLGVVLVRRGNSSGGDACLAAKGGVRYGLTERMAIGVDYTFFMYGAISAIIGEPLGNDTYNLRLRWEL